MYALPWQMFNTENIQKPASKIVLQEVLINGYSRQKGTESRHIYNLWQLLIFIGSFGRKKYSESQAGFYYAWQWNCFTDAKLISVILTNMPYFTLRYGFNWGIDPLRAVPEEQKIIIMKLIINILHLSIMCLFFCLCDWWTKHLTFFPKRDENIKSG